MSLNMRSVHYRPGGGSRSPSRRSFHRIRLLRRHARLRELGKHVGGCDLAGVICTFSVGEDDGRREVGDAECKTGHLFI